LSKIKNGDIKNIAYLTDINIHEGQNSIQTKNGAYKKCTDLSDLLQRINEKCQSCYPYFVFYMQLKSSLAARKDKTAQTKEKFVCLINI